MSRLSWKADRDLIISRILAVGNWDAIRWLSRRLPDAELRSWLQHRRRAEQSAIAVLGADSGLAASCSQSVACSAGAAGLGGAEPRMIWHPEILACRQERMLNQIGPALSRRSFYLAGGTAVALHLGHRRSVDFDWFTPERFDPLNIAQELREEGVRFATESTTTGTLHGMVRGVPVGLLRYNYLLLARVPVWRGGIHVAARADLGAMKLAAVAQRGTKKDYVDIYALCQNSKMLRLMLQRYRKKYSVEDFAPPVVQFDVFRRRRPRPHTAHVVGCQMADCERDNSALGSGCSSIVSVGRTSPHMVR